MSAYLHQNFPPRARNTRATDVALDPNSPSDVWRRHFSQIENAVCETINRSIDHALGKVSEELVPSAMMIEQLWAILSICRLIDIVINIRRMWRTWYDSFQHGRGTCKHMSSVQPIGTIRAAVQGCSLEMRWAFGKAGSASVRMHVSCMYDGCPRADRVESPASAGYGSTGMSTPYIYC